MKNAICASLLFVACVAFAADEYPTKPIQMIVPFPAGGPADIVGRLYAQHLSAAVGQQVVTLNRDGASGSIGTAAAARATPDGYTLIFGTTSTMVVNPLVMKQVPYDFWKDFALIGLIANAPHVLAVRD
ncbi:MAG TPA: tripartite tricarboxylate transporter substrate-binding protein, partial [Verrucomicrobiae bacterium]|nr:tripartite tricarboxylate transporter substrate-binding protein [Verrucomicrobiae bacterium]